MLLGQRVEELSQLFDVDQDDPELWKQLYQRSLYFKLGETEKNTLDRVCILVKALRDALDGVEYQSMDLALQALHRYKRIVEHQQAQYMPQNPLDL